MRQWKQTKNSGNAEKRSHMDREQAKQLGVYLRAARTSQQLTLLKLAEITGIHDVTLGRFEAGAFAAPQPDKLVRIAEALGLPLADVFSRADYAVPADLPSFTPYMRSKYGDLPDEAVAQIERYAQKLAKKHGVDLAAAAGPLPGQDETPQPPG